MKYTIVYDIYDELTEKETRSGFGGYMLKILICEDEKDFLEELTAAITTELTGKVRISACNTLEEFRNVTEKEMRDLDLALMDICLGKDDGIELAAQMKEINPQLKIVFISGHVDAYMEGLFLKVKPYGLLRKPLNSRICIRMLEKAAQEKEQEDLSPEKTLALRVIGGEIRKIPLEQVELFESSRRIVTVYFGGKEERCYEKLDHLEKHLPDHFLRCHKSFLVNMDRIRNFEKHRLELESGRIVDVSRSRLKEAREKYFQYVGAKL